MAPPAIPTGQSAPLAAIDAKHHGAWVVIATALGLVLGLVGILIRLYVRVVITPPFSRDDYVHVVATAFATIQSIVVFFGVSQGFGTSIELLDPGKIRQVQQTWAASDILFLIVLYLSKASLIFLFLRLTPNKIQNRGAWATLGLSSVWVIVSVFMIATNCELNRPWPNIADQCPNMFVRWQIVTVVDIIIEVVLVFLAAILVHDLKMPITRKAAVVTAFFFRLPLIAFVLLRLHYLGKGVHSSNPTLDLVRVVVWTQIELHYSTVSVTVPCLRPFMMAVSTDYGATEPRTALGSKAYGSSGSRKGSSYALNSMESGNGQRRNSSNNPSMFHRARMGASRISTGNKIFRSDRSNNETIVTHEGAHDSNSIETNDSRKMIIKKEVDFKVEREEAGAPGEALGTENGTNGHLGQAI